MEEENNQVIERRKESHLLLFLAKGNNLLKIIHLLFLYPRIAKDKTSDCNKSYQMRNEYLNLIQIIDWWLGFGNKKFDLYSLLVNKFIFTGGMRSSSVE